jgi:hypothetical protein
MSTSATQRRLRLIRSPPPGDERPLEFAIRFTASTGLAAWLRRPANSFGWRGRGVARVDEAGLRISARRLKPWGVPRTTRVIRYGEVRDVYREGNAIQLNLRGSGRRAFVRLWAEDAARATRLVALFPAQRTLELEALPRPPEPPRSPAGSAWLLLLILGTLLAFAWFGTARLQHLSSPPRQPPLLYPLPQSQHAAAAAPLTDAELAQLRLELERFSNRSSNLSLQFTSAWNTLLAGDMSQQQFADGLEQWLLPQWNALGRSIAAADPGTPRGRMRQNLQKSVRSWQQALTLYTDGLRQRNPGEVIDALAAVGDARQQQHAAGYELREIERAQQPQPQPAPAKGN